MVFPYLSLSPGSQKWHDKPAGSIFSAKHNQGRDVFGQELQVSLGLFNQENHSFWGLEPSLQAYVVALISEICKKDTHKINQYNLYHESQSTIGIL